MPYQITATIPDANKFVYMVSFNGKPAERYEIELLPEAVVEGVTPLSDAERVDAILTQVSMNAAEIIANEQVKLASQTSVQVSAGKVVI